MIHYEGDIYRPPSEGRSLLIQATVGCSWNRCGFCSLYAEKSFRVRPEEDVLAELEWARRHYRSVEKIFFCDGDALCLSTEKLSRLLTRSRELFGECRSISVYGNARDVLAKSPEELRRLADEGLSIVYLGAESGSDEVLRFVNKGSTAEDMIKAIRLLEDCGIKASVTFISGLGGAERMEEHARLSGELVSQSAPSYFSLLTLVLLPRMPLYQKAQAGEFTPLRTSEVLRETKLFFESINLPERLESISSPGQYRQPCCLFRSNHISNALPLRGSFPQDKQALIAALSGAMGE